MRLYPKRLRNIEDLEKEKQFLIKKSKQLDKEDFLSIGGLTGGLTGKKTPGDKANGDGSLLDFLPGSNPVISLVVKMLQRILSKKEKKPKIAYAPPPAGTKKAGKNKLKAIAKEFIGGYLKWKAIELSYRGIRYLIKSRMEEKEAEV